MEEVLGRDKNPSKPGTANGVNSVCVTVDCVGLSRACLVFAASGAAWPLLLYSIGWKLPMPACLDTILVYAKTQEKCKVIFALNRSPRVYAVFQKGFECLKRSVFTSKIETQSPNGPNASHTLHSRKVPTVHS